MSSTTPSESSSTARFVLYHYKPSRVAAGVFVALFTLCTLAHLYKVVRYRTWYLIPFLIGLIFEVAGYGGRSISAGQSPNWTTGPYLLQSLTLLLGPTLLAASIYMILGRLIRTLSADACSVISLKWLTKVFVLGDVLSFLTQSGGGGMLANAKTEDTIALGEHIILGGLFIQIIFFGFFIMVTSVFHRRIVRTPTSTSLSIAAPWQHVVYVLYAASILIMVRSIFRVAEYAGGYSGTLQSTEAYIYMFDASLIFLVTLLFVVWHPSSVIPPPSKNSIPLSGSAECLDSYHMAGRV